MCTFGIPKTAAATLLTLLLGTGCAVRKPVFQTYRLVKQGDGQVLIPPGVSAADVTQRTFTTNVSVRPKSCSPVAGLVGIQVRKNRLTVNVKRESLVDRPPGWLSTWAAEIESNGCIGPGDGSKLADLIATSLPLDPSIAFRLLYSSQIDIGPQAEIEKLRLQVVSPVLRDGAPADAAILGPAELSGKGDDLNLTVKVTADLVGYEVAWYGIRRKTDGVGFTIVALYAERHSLTGETERRAAPTTNQLHFPENAAFYRLFYQAEQTDFIKLVIAARSQAELDQRTKLLESGRASCRQLNDELCLTIPKNAAVNLMIPLTVNGAETMVHWGSTVSDVIRTEGRERQTDLVLPRLVVQRLYQGRPIAVEFDRASREILGLVLTGGEVIAWR